MATTAAVGDAVAVSAAPVVVGVVGAGRVVLAGATEVVVPADVVVRVRAGCAARSSSARWNSRTATATAITSSIASTAGTMTAVRSSERFAGAATATGCDNPRVVRITRAAQTMAECAREVDTPLVTVLGLLGQRFGEDRVQRCQLGNPIADRRG